MDGIKRLGALVLGGIAGFAAASAVAKATAPEAGDDLPDGFRKRIEEARLAGEMARAEAEADMASRYRDATGDSDAFSDIIPPR